MIYKKPSCR